MADILNIFSGNPLTTFMGRKIEAATRPELDSEDWALNLEICDIINENDDEAKDAVRAIKKRLHQIDQDRDFIITNRTLTVLETCVSNCSHRFHGLVMTKDFIQDLVKLIGPKNNPPIELQDRVLRMIERWAEAFRSQPDLSGVVTVYNELKAKGVTFPPKDPATEVPIQTPQRSVPPTSSPQPPLPHAFDSRMQLPPFGAQPGFVPQPPVGFSHHPQMIQPPPGPVIMEGESYQKVSSDLSVVQSSVEVFNDILRLLESKDEQSDWNLASDLNSTCRQMKERIVHLIERVANEDLTIELLRLNDELINAFTKYDRLIKNRSIYNTIQPPGAQAQIASTGASDPVLGIRPGGSSNDTAVKRPIVVNEPSLIDLDADTPALPATSTQILRPVSSELAATKPKSPLPNEPKNGDSFARDLEKLTLDSNPTNSSSTSAKRIESPVEISSVREQDFAEIENWLSGDIGRAQTSGGGTSHVKPVSIADTEFEKFIETRALAGGSTTAIRTQDQAPGGATTSADQASATKKSEP